MNNTLLSLKKENQLNIIDEPITNKKNRNKIIENNNKDDFIRNISDIYFIRQSKTQENNNKSKNVIYLKVLIKIYIKKYWFYFYKK